MQLTSAKVLFSAWEEKEDNNLHADNLIRESSENADFGSMMLRSEVLERNERGFMRKAVRVAFIGGEIDFLETLIKDFKIKDGTDHNKLWGEHRITVEECLETELPEDRDEYDNGFSVKLAGADGVELTKGGVLIYRKTYLSAVSEDIEDRLIQHDPIDSEGMANSELEEKSKGEFETETKAEEKK